MTNQRVTLYIQSEFGIGFNKHEGTLIEFGRRKYAQYDAAPFVDMTPKRKRKAYRFLQGYKPWMVLVEGWGHPDVGNPFEKVTIKDDVIITQSTVTCFDKGFETHADKFINNSGFNILFDGRG